MKQLKNYFFFICLLLGSLNMAFAAYDAGDGIYYLKTSDGHEEYTVDGSVTFKAVKSGTIPGYRDAGVTFAPANPGELIHIKVETIDLDGTGNYLLLYNGYIRTGYSGASTTAGCAATNYMPCGYFAQIGTAAADNEYTSEAEDGKLTIGFHSSSANGQTGFNITVTSLSPKDMEFVSAGVFSDNASVNRGGRNQVLLGVNLNMDGGGNPHTLNELVFNTSAFSATQIENLRLYSSATFTEANLLATVPTVGATISYNGNITLRNGDNKFYLVADVKPNANGTITSATLTSVKINNEAKTISPATVVNSLAIANTILMSNEHLTYTISENANFYDDGGTSGKIASNFEGTITFVPATAGKKIKIDFSKLEIFNTSTTGLNDIFKFYNGRTVDEENLIATLLKDAKIIKSTADDGSLTVTLKSITGVPANGWEAVVSEFVPGPMTFDALEVSQPSTETVSGGDADQAFLLLNLKATNTQTPLALQSVYINASATKMQALDKAKLYYLGENNTFSTTNLFGEVAVSGASIQINGTQELKEGNNYFALVYDITNAASNGDIISAAVSKITVSGEEKTPETPITAGRTVANIFKSQAGYYTKEIHDAWTYTDTKSPYSSNLYDYKDADCYVTFKPTVPGSVAQIDFSAFDVYYANSNYGTKAVFEIYSGDAATEANLLWRLSDESQSKTGPGRVLRSVAADGSITIKFNAKTSSSYYAGTGWMATVAPFVNHNMTVEEINVFQNNSNNLRPSSTNQEIIGFSIQTKGNLSTQQVKEIKINLKKSQSVIEKVSIFYTANENNFSQAVLFGSTTNVSTQEVSITGEQNLPEGISYFWLAYDIKGDAVADAQVDAALLSVKTQDVTPYVPANGDPEGNRIIKNTIELTNGNNGQVTLTQPVKFYDEGGANEDYGNVSTFPFDGKITFLPAGEGQAVKIEFSKMDVTNTNYLYIYEGTEVDESKLVATIKGYHSSPASAGFPQPIISASPDGALTVRFAANTKPTISYEGWEADVYSYVKSALYVDNITTSQVGDATIMRGSGNAVVQQIQVSVKGDFDEVTLNNFNFTNGATTNAGDITNASLYYTGTSTGMVLDNQVGASATTSPYVFTATEDIKIDKAGNYYFYLAYDIKADATPGNTIGASLTGVSVNGTVNSDITVTTAVSRSVKSGLQGEYVIGSSDEADYDTFAAAVAAAKDGIEGPVVFKIEAGTYNENVLVSAIPGASASNTITFTSLSGNNNDVIITGTGNNTNTVEYVFKVEQTPFVVLENVSLIPASQSYKNALHISDQSRYFTLRNCVLQANVITGSGIYNGLNLVRVEGVNEEGKNCDFFTAEGNTFTGGYIGVYMYGTGYVALTKQRGAVIRNNTLTDQYAKGIYLPDEQDALIEGNTISNTATVKTGFQGMDIYRSKGQLIVRNNSINLSQNVYAVGIEFRSEAGGTAQTPALVYNNSISIGNSPNASTYGILLSGDCANISFYHNSVNIAGASGRCLGITGSYITINNMTFQNNLLQNNTADGSVYFFSKAEQFQAFTFSNNAYYGNGDFTNTYPSFADWTEASNEQNSIEEQAVFMTPSDLHLMEQGELNAALPIDFIKTDAEGNFRSLTTPTIGAYEYAPIVVTTPEIEEGYPKTGIITYNSIEVKTKWNQSGNLYYIIKEASEEAPTASEILETTAINLNSGLEYTSKFMDLEEETAYKAYFIFVNVFDLESDIAESDVVTTLKQIFPLSVTLSETLTTVPSGTEVEITSDVSGAVAPYSYEWRNQMNEVISTESTLIVSPTVAQQYRLTVTSSDSQSKVLYTDVIVRGEAAIATFEDNYLEEESYWQGREGEEGDSKFYSGSFAFANSYYPSMFSWTGYSYSNVTATAFDPSEFSTHQFRSVTGKGAEESNTYAVLYDMGWGATIEVTHSEEGMTIPGVYLTNAAWTYSSMTEGDAIAGDPFGQGDYFTVTFTGNTGTTVTYPLADYRSEDETEHYILTDWQWFDLSPLGNITNLTVSVDASRKTNYGGTDYLDTPAYLCMDNLGASTPTISIKNPMIDVQMTVYPNPFADYIILKTDAGSHVSIYDVSGQCVLNTITESSETRIETSNFSKGTYIIRCGEKVAKVVK